MYGSSNGPTVRLMEELSFKTTVALRVDPSPLRVFCDSCEHSEFIHGDYAPRSCLFADCACSGFGRGDSHVASTS